MILESRIIGSGAQAFQHSDAAVTDGEFELAGTCPISDEAGAGSLGVFVDIAVEFAYRSDELCGDALRKARSRRRLLGRQTESGPNSFILQGRHGCAQKAHQMGARAYPKFLTVVQCLHHGG